MCVCQMIVLLRVDARVTEWLVHVDWQLRQSELEGAYTFIRPTVPRDHVTNDKQLAVLC